MGQVTNQMNAVLAIVSDLEVAQRIVEARANIQRAVMEVQSSKQKNQEIQAGGDFDSVPAALKQALLDGHGVMEDLLDAVQANADLLELLTCCGGWVP